MVESQRFALPILKVIAHVARWAGLTVGSPLLPSACGSELQVAAT